MPQISITVPHELEIKDAGIRIKSLLTDLGERYQDQINDIEESWEEDKARFSFQLMGFSISGTLLIETRLVRLDGTIPFLAVPFKSQVEKTIRESAESLLC